MRTQYEIRNPVSDGIFISFDTEGRAMDWWNQNVKWASRTHLHYGAIVVRHSWETELEKETARLDWLEGEQTEIFQNKPSKGHNLEDVIIPVGLTLRQAIDAKRNAPESTTTVIWPLRCKA